jgi:transcriptional regulator with XRE-family HTH domain
MPTTPHRPRLAAACAADGRYYYAIAAAAECSPNTLSALITGAADPKPDVAGRLAAVLGYDVEALFGDHPLVVA